MMPTSLCCDCGSLIHTRARRCLNCTRRINHRKAGRNITTGRNTRHWRKIRQHAIATYGQCATCGTTSHLTAHLRPALHGDHRAATTSDVVVLCRSCHSRLEAETR